MLIFSISPADRVTDFTQRKNLVQIEDFLPGILDDIAKEIGASDKEKEAMRYFGTIKVVQKLIQKNKLQS
ncbi:hypothetical protein [Mycoplasmopsis cynos]|uniref:hypothetical protein n=1 Tax=Mycoplasmopsis cynos TaxID=171284 RepID=UPI0024C9A5F5|nr:hypothetical protein [Mycoplasmopsis cynos]WAM04813.1 hypothetical protein ONA01_01110 [Mycoplasmopsis cynos]